MLFICRIKQSYGIDRTTAESLDGFYLQGQVLCQFFQDIFYLKYNEVLPETFRLSNKLLSYNL
jgi:hypothetical protein